MASPTTNMVRDTGGVVGVAIASAIGFGNATALPRLPGEERCHRPFLAIVNHVASIGGPVAVAHANLGPQSALSMSAGQGFRPPRLMGLVAGLTQTAGALLIGPGLASVLGVAILTGVLTTVVALHLPTAWTDASRAASTS